VILLLHNRYRTRGGEERTVEALSRVIRDELGEETELLERDSAAAGRLTAARGLLRGGLDPAGVGAAVRRSGARVVHAHNVHPQFGWRALHAARSAGARTVLHLHQYRLVCAVGTCLDPSGADCTRCHGRDTLPGVRLRCRGSAAEAVVYAGALAAWSARLVEQADALVAPSAFTVERLRALGAPIDGREVHVVANPVETAAPGAPAQGEHVLYAGRLSPDKGVDVAIEACARTGRPLVIAGAGPQEAELRDLAARRGGDVRFAGWADAGQLAALRSRAALAIVPSRFAETFGLACAEAMAAGLPVAASAIGALPELLPADDLAPPGDVAALAERVERLWGDAEAGARNAGRIAEHAAPAVVARQLAVIYDG
jgi:glycosyltransferase involved in cell wall biosynthesis